MRVQASPRPIAPDLSTLGLSGLFDDGEGNIYAAETGMVVSSGQLLGSNVAVYRDGSRIAFKQVR